MNIYIVQNILILLHSISQRRAGQGDFLCQGPFARVFCFEGALFGLVLKVNPLWALWGGATHRHSAAFARIARVDAREARREANEAKAAKLAARSTSSQTEGPQLVELAAEPNEDTDAGNPWLLETQREGLRMFEAWDLRTSGFAS